MKTINHLTKGGGNALRALFVTVLLVIPATLAAQNRNAQDKNEQLGPVGRTEEIINVMSADLSIPLEQFSFFLPGKLGIYNVEPYQTGHIIMLPSGRHSFLVTPNLTAEQMGRFNYTAPDEAIRVDCDLEPGKFYTFKHDKMNSLIGIGKATNVSVVELFDQEGKDDTERIARNFKEFVEYYTANPLALEGTYATKNGKSEIVFAGDRFKATITFSGKKWIYEGSFRFNGDTIIAEVESQTQTFGKNTKTDMRAYEIWGYKKTGDVLEIIGKSANVMMGTKTIKGTYTKTVE